MADIKRFILKPTLDSIQSILHMKDCKVVGIEDVLTPNKLTLNSGHIDLEFDATYRAVSPNVMIENLPELIVDTQKAQYKIPKYNAHFEGTSLMGGAKTGTLICVSLDFTQSSLDASKLYCWRFIYPVDSDEWFHQHWMVAFR